jgi:hypothetical protein
MSKPAPYHAHAIVLVETPRPIFAAAWMGAGDLRIEFDRTLPSAVWLRYCLGKLADLNAFWKPRGLVINYAADMAVRYGLDGAVEAVLDRPVSLPQVTLRTIH